MGQNSSKSIHSLILKLKEKDLKETELYSELLHLDDTFKSDNNFYLIKKIVDDVTNLTFLFKFLMNTLKNILQDSSDERVRECKVCVKICLSILPVIQYNYKKRDIFSLMWKENCMEILDERNYICNNILILHIFNFLLIILFTENISINKAICESRHSGITSPDGSANPRNMVLVKNTIDVYRLWLTKFSIHEQVRSFDINSGRNGDTTNSSNSSSSCVNNENRSSNSSSSFDNDRLNNEEGKNVDPIMKDIYYVNGKKKKIPLNEQDSSKTDGRRNHWSTTITNSKMEKYELNNRNKQEAEPISHKDKPENYLLVKDAKGMKYGPSNETHFRNGDEKINTIVANNNMINLELIKNRIKILKCLLILLSSYIYYDDKNYLKEKNFFLFLFTSGEVYFTANFFLSLLTVIYDNEFNYFSFYFYNDTYLEFYNLCIHTLNILIDFNPFILRDNKKVHYMNSAVRYYYKSRFSIDKKEKHIYSNTDKEEEHESDFSNPPKEEKENKAGSKKSESSVCTPINENVCYFNNIETDDTLPYENEKMDTGSKAVRRSSKEEKQWKSQLHTNLKQPLQQQGQITDPGSSTSLSSASLDGSFAYNDSFEESCYSSESDNNDIEKCACTNKKSKKKKKKKFYKLEQVLKNKKKYLKEYNQKEEEKHSDNYYIYVKNKKEAKNMQCNNVFLEMIRNLELDNMQYIYKGTLNILISYKLYFENFNENILFIDSYLCLLWHLMNNNKLFIKYIKNHNSSIFLFYILYILLCFNNHRKREMQRLADSRKREGMITTALMSSGMNMTSSNKKEENDEKEKFIYNNENYNKSNKCDEFNIRKIDGLIYICLFIILKISSNSAICKNLNEKYDQKIKINFLLKNISHFDTYVDFLVYVLYMIVNDNIYFLKFERIIDMSITILTNMSVYIKSMNTYSCEYIISILKKILKKEWILSSQHHYYSLFLILDFINNILSHNLNDNYNLVYMIIKNKDVFFSIHNLDEELKNNYLFDSNTPTDYWVPTQSWLVNWKNKLPLHFINSIIYDLAILIEEECDEKEVLDYNEVVNLIKNHCSTIKNKKIPFIIRKYEKNMLLSKWVTSYIYFLLFFHMYKENLFINNGIKFIS
ncbi:conserved Plasmodium protein, unknown function [Plasmodium malariae]|uniref:HID1 domain-containing protein n=1 Tax=Plasmodium malariae TaxID=5858 RepID=A0A1D3TCM6_PLAMA|nr:conserved Plasmodium protein, unknown function [Plasmodium malariae]SCP02625.1 conserved Plasmodium protein, unknown function [Plasmodium malariae]